MAKVRPSTIANFFETLNPSCYASRQARFPYWQQQRRAASFFSTTSFRPTPRSQVPPSRSRPWRILYNIRTFTISTRASTFIYRLAASFNAKDTHYNPSTDHSSFDPTLQSSPSTESPLERPNSGQDACFTSNVGNESDVAFAVADGVGGWSDSGIDSAHFSHGLCEHMTRFARGSDHEKMTENDGPRDLLQHGYDAVLADDSIVGGGTTACVATGRSDGTLSVANLGDSGFIQLRLNAVHYHSTPQTHAFNTPYQLSIVPPKMLARSKLFGGNTLSDLPRDANFTTHQTRHGDILIFATDGVWDNLSPADILRIVSRQMKATKAWVKTEQGTTASEDLIALTRTVGSFDGVDLDLQSLLAISVTREAKVASLNIKRDGPFAREVQRYYPGEDFHGGKVDDICVVVAVVVET
ncbi:MAG: hypothetical protein LQ347_003537 [Umbilicaria vellea]|nr:MAG: hypothetical protein LQ347_003537 [Umbilicaria vellea]